MNNGRRTTMPLCVAYKNDCKTKNKALLGKSTLKINILAGCVASGIPVSICMSTGTHLFQSYTKCIYRNCIKLIGKIPEYVILLR